MKKYKCPIPTVDIIIEIERENGQEGIILIKRKNPPHGWALPGGFVDYGESLEEAAVREAKEETSLDIKLKNHDAQDIRIFTEEEINFPLAFDHQKILADYFKQKSNYY
jgi:ADP-ribose pyrophosphatase YjhB (NUDIX family)